MSNHRLIYALAVLAIFVAVAQCEDIVIGKRVNGDSLAESAFIKEPARNEESLLRRETFRLEFEKKITAVELYDRNKDKDGAYAELFEGGPGQSYVVVGFHGNPGHAIEYLVRIYAI